MRQILRILTGTRELWPLYTGIVLASVASAATALLTPFIIASATERVVEMATGGDVEISPLIWLAVALMIVMLSSTVITNIGGFWGDLMTVRLRVILSQRYYHKLMRLPQSYYDSEVTGTVISRLNRSITSITDFLKMLANGLFTMLITVLAVLVIAAFHSPWLAILLLVIYPAFVFLTALTSRKWQRWERLSNTNYDIANGRFAEVVGQMRVVKSFVAEKRELAAFGRLYDETVTITKKQSSFWHRMDVARRAALDVVFFFIYAIIFVQTAQGIFSIGSMILLIQLVNLAKQPVMSMSWLVDSSQRAITGSNEYFRVMETDDEPNNPLEPQPSAQVEWSDTDPVIRFDGVSFGYDSDDLVLKDINLEINQGERIALVGESGGGKTTMVNLLMKLYEPTAGSLSVHGQPVPDVPAVALRQSIGCVFQDANLFSGTIRDNLTYGRPHASDGDLELAARRANALTFIRRLPAGFDTEIGERGIKLSGGQKQRVSVARAILKDAPILILDEATSSLDTKAERQVQAGLEELMEGRTSVIIAHRLSTISTVDRIVTLQDGRIDEVGTPAELAASGGIYSELLELQHSTDREDKKRLLRYDIIS